MLGSISAWSRRAALIGGGSLVFIAFGPAQAQSARTRKFEAWVQHIVRTTPEVAPMSNGSLLDFPTEKVPRKQIGVTRGGVNRLFAVVTPLERDGIILAAGNPEAKTFSVHRTGTHLRRISSARNLAGRVSRWSGPECDNDFAAQVDFWAAEPVR